MFEASRDQSAFDARVQALRLAYAPLLFQAIRSARASGLLAAVEAHPRCDAGTLARSCQLSEYAARVLLEACLAQGAVSCAAGAYELSKMGHFFLHDPLAAVALDFVHDVCYRGAAHLDEALRTGRPAGLHELTPATTVYEGLAQLAPHIRDSWLRYDHYHSDRAFEDALPLLLKHYPRTLLDVGGNTGRFTARCRAADPELRITLADLPGQLDLARAQLTTPGHADHIRFHAIDLLRPDQPLPPGQDAIWMSQLLVCFSPPQITDILRRARAALAPGGRVFILETFWDRQQYEIAAHCMIAASLYFTCIANGNSRMYTSADLQAYIHDAGLHVHEQHDRLGVGHTLLVCGP